MGLLALDLSTSCTGLALFNDKGKLEFTVDIVPHSKMSTEEAIHFIAWSIKDYFPRVQSVVIEDVYYSPKRVQSFKVLSRLAGAILYTCIEYFKVAPTFYTATSCRKLVGLAPDIAKVETQLYILEKFYPETDISSFYKAKDVLRREYVKRKLTKNQWDYRLTKLSDEVSKATGFSNDRADAVVVGLAHLIKTNVLQRLK